MKKVITAVSLILASIVCPIISSCGSNSNQPKRDRRVLSTSTDKDTFSLRGENTISLAYDYISSGMATIYENDAHSDIMINTTPINAPAMPILKKSDIETLYQQVCTLSSGGNYITAVEIFFGINNGNLTYYLQPVCLHTSASVTSPGPYLYTIAQTGPNLYEYNVTTNSIITPAPNFTSDTINYAHQIKIIHYYGAAPSFTQTLDTSPNVNADTKCVIFPFQEIFHMLDCNSVDSITVYNAGAPAPVQGGYFTKHDLLLAPFIAGGQPSSNTSAVEEDLAHMIPPDYGNLIYPITF